MDFEEIPYSETNAIIPWFINMIEHSSEDEKKQLIKFLKYPEKTPLLT
ncbi:hypothetical protein MNB_SM-5-1200 [hydrothermal vent metagenome]|uniref:Uncharacterized protein n=1 Tax=hydrothermal vent metagenome TaxID=652676 RepID=A0A1W1BB27_9ZZZZ